MCDEEIVIDLILKQYPIFLKLQGKYFLYIDGVGFSMCYDADFSSYYSESKHISVDIDLNADEIFVVFIPVYPKNSKHRNTETHTFQFTIDTKTKMVTCEYDLSAIVHNAKFYHKLWEMGVDLSIDVNKKKLANDIRIMNRCWVINNILQ